MSNIRSASSKTEERERRHEIRYEIYKQQSRYSNKNIRTKIGDTLEVRISLFQVIDKTARCRNYNLYTGSKVTDLTRLGDSAIHTSILDLRGRSKFVAFLLDLNSKLSRRSKYKDDRTFTRFQVGL
jgi:hypothetical protein